MDGEPDCLTAALRYQALGWSVLPLCPPDHVGVGKDHRGCKSPGKRPFFPSREGRSGEWRDRQGTAATADELRREWEYHPRLNVGAALGPVSGLVGIDVDDEDGETLLRELSGGDLPETWEYTTGKGRRLLYRLPAGAAVVNHSFRRPGTEIEILRLMSAGGQVVLPPSVHPNGAAYRWVRSPDDGPAADAPAWMRDAGFKDGQAARPADGELITEGGRNNYLTSLAGAMRKRGADEYAILAALTATNESRFDPPLSESEVLAVARSVARYAPDEFTAVTIKFPEPGTGDGKRDLPEPKSAGDVARIADLKNAGAAVKWLCPGWIQRGVLTLLAAEGGTGKTRTTADLIRRIRYGLPWPDGTPMTEQPVETVALWVVADNHHDEMVSLTEAFGIADCVAINAHPAEPFEGTQLETIEDLRMLELRVRAVRPMVVIVDTVGNSTDKNLSKQEDAKAFYHPLQVIARRYGVAVLCLTHLNAGGKVLGRRALEKVRTCIRLSAERINDPKCKRRLEVTKSNSKYPAALGVTMGDGGNEYDNNPPVAPEDREKEPPPEVRACAEWRREKVRDRPRAVAELLDEAQREKGFEKSEVFKAKDHARLIESRVPSGGRGAPRKFWGLPGINPEPPELVLPEPHE